jgi:endonuclease-3 related protein
MATSRIAKELLAWYDAMLERFGPQNWWPARTPFEVLVGAVLTQNTNWQNVSRAIENLRRADLLDPHALDSEPIERLAQHIRPAGYFNIKARRLKNLVRWLVERCGGDVSAMGKLGVPALREELLGVRGVGPETADAIILYAVGLPTFVVDAYTARVLYRHHLIDGEADYEEIKSVFEGALPADVQLYNEYHALLVEVGKRHCRPRARCGGCPLEPFEHEVEPPEGDRG